MARKIEHGVKFNLLNYECDNCSTGVVQVLETVSRNNLTQKVSGCLDCKKEIGIHQAFRLNKYTREDTTYAS